MKPGAESCVHFRTLRSVVLASESCIRLELSSWLAGRTHTDYSGMFLARNLLKTAESSRCCQLNDICNETTCQFLFMKVNQQGTTQSTFIFKWRIIRKTQNKLDLKSVSVRVQIIELNFSFGATSRRTKVLMGEFWWIVSWMLNFGLCSYSFHLCRDFTPVPVW